MVSKVGIGYDAASSFNKTYSRLERPNLITKTNKSITGDLNTRIKYTISSSKLIEAGSRYLFIVHECTVGRL